jgi:hypothetical protein
MRHFRVSRKNEGIWQIQASSVGEFSPALLESLVERFRRLDLKITKSADITYFVESTDDSNPDDIGGFLIEFGWQTHGDPPGHFIRASSFDQRTDPAIRYAFINNSITHLGLNNVVQIEGDEDGFTLTSAPGWSLYEFETWLNKRNPSFFRTGPFSSFDEVWQCAERFRVSPLCKRIDRLAVSYFVAPDVYETMCEQLNEVANEWGVSFFGSYADGIDPYTQRR